MQANQVRVILIALGASLFGSNEGLGSDMSQSLGDVHFDVARLSRIEDSNQVSDFSFDPNPKAIVNVKLPSGRLQVGKFRAYDRSAKGGTVVYTVRGRTWAARISSQDGSFDILVPLNSPREVISFRTVDNKGYIHSYSVRVKSDLREEKRNAKKLNFDVGLGLSYLDYVENIDSLNFRITEIGLTAKVGANYVLSKDFELGGNTFITAYPYPIKRQRTITNPLTSETTVTQDTIEPARWFGINGRLGYRLPIESKAGSYHVMAGYYVWGMLAPAADALSTYGVEYLGGVQMLFSGRFQTAKKRSYYGYLKFATIQDTGLISLTNRELAIGGGLQISKPDASHRRWMLTLDVADARFAKASQNFRLLSFSAGISTNF